MGRPSRFSPEVRERAVRMVEEHQEAHASEWAVLQSVAPKLGCTAETLRKWVRQAQRDAGHRPGLTTSERERLKELEREVRGRLVLLATPCLEEVPHDPFPHVGQVWHRRFRSGDHPDQVDAVCRSHRTLPFVRCELRHGGREPSSKQFRDFPVGPIRVLSS